MTFLGTTRLLALALAGLPAAVPAHAQNALGGGDALSRDTRHADYSKTSRYGVLDANTRVGALGDNGQAAKVDYFSRNLIVTGDVGGGRQFRGNVGYREQSEFTGNTGADDLRFFTAYSVYSSPYMAQANFNPLEASQQFGAIMYTRTYANASARDILTDQQPLDARIAFDRFSADGAKGMRRQADFIDPGNTRDVSERLNWRVTQSRSAANRSERESMAYLENSLSSLGLSAYDRQRLKQDILQGRTQRDMVVGAPLSETSLLPGRSLSDSDILRPTLAPEYRSIVDSLRARAADRLPSRLGGGEDARKAEVERRLGGDMDWLRGQLIRSGVESGRDGEGRLDAPGTDATGGGQPARPAPDGGMGARDDAGAGSRGEAASTGSKDADRDAERKPNIDDLAYILRHGRKLQSLVPEDSGAIKDMMSLGASAMSRGEYFRAEERYGSVLQVLPNSATALAGVANAQLGAGLHVSSALSLRKLYAMHPEMIDTHFGAEVMPSAVRLEAALASARERLDAANRPGASPDLQSDRFDFGLVIAYVGFQTDRPAVIREGLDAMRVARPDDAMLGLLQRVWLPPADAAPAPAPAP